MAIWDLLRSVVRDATRLDRSSIAPTPAWRNAIGVVLPLAVGAAAGQTLAGLPMAIGALQVAFAERPGPYGLRVSRMLLVDVAAAIAVFVGSVTGTLGPLFYLLLALWALGSGLLVALGPVGAQLGMTNVILLLVFSAQPASISHAAVVAALVFGGGLIQVALALTPAPIRPFAPQQNALAGVFRDLAAYLEQPPDGEAPPPALANMTEARTNVGDLDGEHSHAGEALLTILALAERARIVAVALIRNARRCRDAVVQPRLREALDALATRCRTLATTLATNGRSRESPASRRRAIASIAALAQANSTAAPAEYAAALSVAEHAERLNVLLAAALAVAEDLASRRAGVRELAAAARLPPPKLGEPLATLRANLHWESPALRHAVRLAGCVAAVAVAAQGASLARSYWAPMTVAIVLRPDYGATFSRGVARMAGTIVGLLLATALAVLTYGRLPWEIGLIGLLVFVIRSMVLANYGIAVVAISGLIVLLTALTGGHAEATILARGVDTLVGGAFALLAFAVWPTWERTQMTGVVADLLEAYRRYFRAAIAPATGAPVSQSVLDATRQGARLARTNAEASLARLRAEPGTPPALADRYGGAIAAAHRFVQAVLAFEGQRRALESGAIAAAWRDFAASIDATCERLIGALRQTASPTGPPDLTAALARLQDAIASRSATPPSENDAREVLPPLQEAERMAESLGTVALLLTEAPPDTLPAGAPQSGA